MKWVMKVLSLKACSREGRAGVGGRGRAGAGGREEGGGGGGGYENCLFLCSHVPSADELMRVFVQVLLVGCCLVVCCEVTVMNFDR